MAVQTFKGTFACPASTGNQSVSGLGFTPQAIIFFSSGQTATGYAAGSAVAIGAMTTSNLTSTTTKERDASTSSTTSTRQGTGSTTQFLVQHPTNIGTAGVFTRVSIDADGFTVNWSTVLSGLIVHYWAIGGISNAKAGGGGLQFATAGNQSFTGVGFQPDAILMFANANESGNMGMSVGAATSASSRACSSFDDANSAANVTQVSSQQVSTLVLNAMYRDASEVSADLVSMDSDGFTLNFVNPGAVSFVNHSWIAIKGGNPAVGVDTQKTSTGTKSTIGAGSPREGVMIWSTNLAASTSLITNTAKLSIGASDGTNHGAIWAQSQDAVGTTNTDERTVTTVAIGMSTQAATTNAEATVTSLDNDGFTLDWTTADATAREFVHFSIGGLPPDPIGKFSGLTQGMARAGAIPQSHSW
jgi:hypothetical protein